MHKSSIDFHRPAPLRSNSVAVPNARRSILGALFVVSLASVAWGQFGDGSAATEEPAKSPVAPVAVAGSEKTEQWKVGMRITAKGGPCAGLFATVPVPTEWEDQRVEKVSEDVSPHVKGVRFRDVDGVRQLLVTIPKLARGEVAHAIFLFEVDRKVVEAPAETESLRVPKKVSRDLKKYLVPSPAIESRHKAIRELAKSLKDDSLGGWKQTEKLYDWVRENIEYENGKLKGALAALKDGTGDCEELTSLFIALCRCHNIPARTVWIPGHCYPEFYLVDGENQGHWYPCQAAGTREFGSMHEQRPILQKGDNFRVPEKKERQRYVAEFLTGKAIQGGGKPSVEFIREAIAVDEK